MILCLSSFSQKNVCPASRLSPRTPTTNAVGTIALSGRRKGARRRPRKTRRTHGSRHGNGLCRKGPHVDWKARTALYVRQRRSESGTMTTTTSAYGPCGHRDHGRRVVSAAAGQCHRRSRSNDRSYGYLVTYWSKILVQLH